MRALGFVLILFLAGCAKDAKVSVFKPHLVRGMPAVDADRLAQQTIRRALKEERREPLAALASLVEAAELSAQQLEGYPGDVDARRDYNFAVARICGVLREANLRPWLKPVLLGTRTLAWKPHPRPEWNPADYDLIPADQLKVRGVDFDTRETKDGLGAPVVAKRRADQLRDLAPTPHFFYAATIVARFEGTRCVLAIEDPMERETVRLGRHSYPLAADYSSPLAMLVVELHPEQLGMPRLLHPAKFAATTRIGRIEPFDPNKTVVLIVHGLMSSPSTWFPLLNHLRADETIRRQYQFWFFSYPSGYPYPYSAAILRKELDAAEKLYPQRKKMIVLGHSMGSCISRLLITDSGDRIWQQMFTVPPGKMEVSESHKHILTECTIFQHRPEVGRVIFVSGPHRGAGLASNWAGRLMAGLVKLPVSVFGNGVELLRFEKGTHHLKRFPDSVDTLDPGNDFVVALKNVPMVKGVPYHSIIGDRGRGDSPRSSDGVVPYWSSHLDGAQSEKIVPSHHGAHQHPAGIAEIERILNLPQP